jgi:hypothetical protein
MNNIDEALTQIDSLAKVLKKNKTPQIRSNEEKGIIKATAFSWFKNIREKICLSSSILADVDICFNKLLEFSERDTSRKSYLAMLKALRNKLVQTRSENIVQLTQKPPAHSDPTPDLSTLIKDHKMISILTNRWSECVKCIQADAPLSSVVMMGGLLETILLAKINSCNDKSRIFNAKLAPIDKKTTKVYPLQEWKLKNYIDVSHELGWISQSAKDIGEVLRDYRNYIHPYKEFSHGISLLKSDAELFWQITKNIIKQLL